MGVQVKLVMVGPYAGCNKSFKNVPFRNGVGYVRGPEDKIMHIVKYLKGYGAYPHDLAEAKQKEIDDDLAAKGNKKVLIKRRAALKAQMEELEKLEAAASDGDDDNDDDDNDEDVPVASDAPIESGDQDVPVPVPETPEGRGGKQAQGGKTSGKRGNH